MLVETAYQLEAEKSGIKVLGNGQVKRKTELGKQSNFLKQAKEAI